MACALALAATACTRGDGTTTGPTTTVTETASDTTTVSVEPSQADTAKVPRLVGLPLADARRLIREAGLELQTQIYNFAGDTRFGVRRVASARPPGTVLQQSVDPHTSVRMGRGIKLAVAAPPPGPCDPSYPDVCIPRYPPDLDCPQVLAMFGYVNIRVVGSDPHGLDNGGTPGVGCETS